jgi:hypothetical protein
VVVTIADPGRSSLPHATLPERSESPARPIKCTLTVRPVSFVQGCLSLANKEQEAGSTSLAPGKTLATVPPGAALSEVNTFAEGLGAAQRSAAVRNVQGHRADVMSA